MENGAVRLNFPVSPFTMSSIPSINFTAEVLMTVSEATPFLFLETPKYHCINAPLQTPPDFLAVK